MRDTNSRRTHSTASVAVIQEWVEAVLGPQAEVGIGGVHTVAVPVRQVHSQGPLSL